MKITFLGTGTSQGIPVIACDCEVCASTNSLDKRLRSSILIQENDNFFVIDTGPDFRQQMLRENVKRVDAILFTHEHKDHIAGLDDIRSYNWIYKKPMDIYAEVRVLEALKIEFGYAFTDCKYPGVPEMILNEISNKPFEINNINIIPVRGFHNKLPIFGYRFKDFAYLTDINSLSYEEIEKLINVKVLIVSALRKKKHLSHYNLEEALALIRIVKPQKAYLTHISHMMGLHKDVTLELPQNVELAYDGLTFEV